jgi:intein/homing endonuclease
VSAAPSLSVPTKNPVSTSEKEDHPVFDFLACFAADEIVQLHTGENVTISSVKVGDKVLSASLSGHFTYATVIAVPHSANQVEASFVSIQTSDSEIKLTRDHLVLASACDTNPSFVSAADVRVGDCLTSIEGRVIVTSVSIAKGKGVYTFVTTEELIVVSGVVASPFSLNHYNAHAFYNLYRYFWSVSKFTMVFNSVMAVIPKALTFCLSGV